MHIYRPVGLTSMLAYCRTCGRGAEAHTAQGLRRVG